MRDASRRQFLLTGVASAALALPGGANATGDMAGQETSASTIALFLCGDVMLGRGIDQILRHPGDPQLHEPYVSSATTYVELAEWAHGPIPRAVDDAYVWGDALDALRRIEPAARIINLETSITESEDFLPKGINYKMHPANAPVLTAADIDCCVLANNHVLDWGYSGLLDTLKTLEQAGIPFAGAGRDAASAAAPAVLPAGGGARVLVFGFGAASSGIPTAWAAERDGPGVDLLPELSEATVEAIAARVRAVRHPADVLVASIHWGGNWGYEIPPEQTAFAHGLIDRAGFDVVHGHSSHHAKAIEIYEGRPILYGCGDFLNDYEGITGKEQFRDDLVVMYLPALAAARGDLVDFPLEVFRIRKFRLQRASLEDTRWLAATLERESRRFGTRLEWREANRLAVRW
jgi:poly-gamma-glutamate capsule biosynthesis protein CapA/YwtB (metallophosphatase superfamily)